MAVRIILNYLVKWWIFAWIISGGTKLISICEFQPEITASTNGLCKLAWHFATGYFAQHPIDAILAKFVALIIRTMHCHAQESRSSEGRTHNWPRANINA